MELPGFEYLFDLSLLAITFAAVSTLVIVVCRMRAGTLTKAETRLLAGSMSAGIVESIVAVLPAALTLIGLTGSDLWAVASATGAAVYAVAADWSKRPREGLLTVGSAPRIGVGVAVRWLPVFILFVNAADSPVQGLALYAGAVTLSLGAAMWSFVQRIGSVVGHNGR